MIKKLFSKVLFSKKFLSIIAILFLVIMGVCYYIYSSDDTNYVPNLDGTHNNYPTFTVEIRGEVNRPGVYEVNETFEVRHLITLAKGFTKDADEASVNLVDKLKSGDKIIVKSLKESSLYDIHKLTLDDFKKIIGLTDKQAQIIYDYIKQVGSLTSYDQLESIGLTNESIQKIKDKCHI